MATTSSQQPANLAKNSTSISARATSSNGQPLSESPTPGLTVPSPSLAASTTNGGTNGLLPTTTVSNDGSVHTDLRLYPRDGRLRNPVPSKLKDVNEQMKGNFSVMHMDVASHRASEGRDAAAKRTSESTALQAKLAQTDSYVSHQRRANYPRPPGLKQFTSPGKSTSAEPAAVDADLNRPLSIAETKTEQARLLTLLRTLPPNTVVDQLCKALAFFGGIPAAPPPADGKFPESAEANGSGSLFVGWIAEIFPNLGESRRQVAPLPQPTQPVNQRRPRGRPKGSKASKSRSDKGIKKGSKGTAYRAQEPQDDSGWIDVEADDSIHEINGDSIVELGGPPGNGPGTPPRAPEGEPFNNTPAPGSAGGFKSINDAATVPGSSAKRRGRPKGSKNRPKDGSNLPQPGQAIESTVTHSSTPNPTDNSSVPPPKVTPVPVPVPMLGEQSKKKANAGRPKGSKNKPKVANDSASRNISTSQQQPPGPSNHTDQHSAQLGGGATSLYSGDSNLPTISDGISSQKDKRTLPPPPPESFATLATTTSSNLTPTPQVKESSITGKKRKRQSAPASIANPQVDGTSGTAAGGSLSQQTQPSVSQAVPTSMSQVHSSAGQPAQQFALGSNVPPAAKRPRKVQESGTLQAIKRPTPNSMVSKNPLESTAASLDQPRQSGQASATSRNPPVTEGLDAFYDSLSTPHNRNGPTQHSSRAQKQQHQSTTMPIGSNIPSHHAEGLEAHFERFTSLQPQQDNVRQQTANRQQIQQHAAQGASPLPSQASKTPQLPSSLGSHQQTRTSQSYYPPTQGLGSSYNTQATTYSTSQRQPQHMATGSPNAGLVQHMSNSPQFGAQSNSPLMQGDTSSYRGSPSLVHSNTGYPPRRTPSASPLDNNYRTTSTASHNVSNHSPHFGARQPPTTTHSTPHTTMASFAPYDSTFLDMQSLEPGGTHGGLGLGAGSYGLGGSGMPSQQRTTSSGAASLYSSAAGMTSTYLSSSNVGRAAQNRWQS